MLDWTLNIGSAIAILSNLILVATGMYAFVKVGLSIRDNLRDLNRAVGSEDPPTGLIGKVNVLDAKVDQHHEWLVAAGIDRRRPGHVTIVNQPQQQQLP